MITFAHETVWKDHDCCVRILAYNLQTLVSVTLQVNNYPSSPFPTAPYVFVQKFKPLTTINPSVSRTCNAVRWMAAAASQDLRTRPASLLHMYARRIVPVVACDGDHYSNCSWGPSHA